MELKPVIKLVESESSMVSLGRSLGSLLKPGDAVALIGGLGAGKTTLSRGIAAGLGATGEITSPTFALMNVYEGPVPVYHLDLYRLEDASRFALLGYDEWQAAEGVTLVEWADKFWPFWTEDVLRLELADAPGGRRLTATGSGARSREVLAKWDRSLLK